MKFELETFGTIGQVRHQIQKCEGKHTQQIAYSSYHDSLTQVCFDCKKVRTNVAFIIKGDLKEDTEVANCEGDNNGKD